MSRPGAPPVVSVIVVSFNHRAFAVTALDSVAAQTFGDFELIVIDDASTDGSPELLEAWMAAWDRPGLLLLHKENQGGCSTLNEAITHAKGEVLAFLSTDDVWLPRHLEVLVPSLRALDPRYGVVYSDAVVIDEAGRLVKESFIKAERSLDLPPEGELWPVLIRGNFIPGVGSVIRRSCLDHVGPYDERLRFEDWDMWLRLARRYLFAYVPEVVSQYRVVTTSLVRSLGNTVYLSNIDIYRKNLGLDPEIDHYLRAKILALSMWLLELGEGSRWGHVWRIASHARSRADVRHLVRAARVALRRPRASIAGASGAQT